jgi:DNA repair protein RecO (recombination protein O)
MPIDQAEAIVLRTYNIGDQDKIAVFLTREHGLVRGVAKGARKFGSRFGSALEPMSHVMAFYYEKERRDLVTVNTCDLLESYFELQADVRTSLTISYFAELIEEFIPGRIHEDLVFRLLLSILRALKEKGDLNLLTRYFEAWVLHINGFLPEVHRCRGCRKVMEESGWLGPKRDGIYCEACAPLKRDEVRGELGRFLHWVRTHPPAKAKETTFSAAELKSIEKSLQAMIIYHLEREPMSLRFLR